MVESKDGRTALGSWSLKETKVTAIGVLVIIAIVAGCFIVQEVREQREIRQLERPTQIRVSGARVDREGTLVGIEMHLVTESGNEYHLIDLSDDGFFPNDADGMIDEVRSTSSYGFRVQRSFSRRLFSRLTERYK